jgi:hypothetical protein
VERGVFGFSYERIPHLDAVKKEYEKAVDRSGKSSESNEDRSRKLEVASYCLCS